MVHKVHVVTTQSTASFGKEICCPSNPTNSTGNCALIIRDLAILRELFGQSWGPLAASEQARALRLLVERVDYDGSAGQVRIRLRSDGITTLARDWAEREEPV